ncbi:MAG: hypothetical protein IT340_00865 [Chloroflexi bacterium]|nr:hypothetical protein [Chloroflexota bacterium]
MTRLTVLILVSLLAWPLASLAPVAVQAQATPPEPLLHAAASSPSWAAVGSLASARSEHTATLLQNGQVLVAGGYSGNALASAELYDPATGLWVAAAAMSSPRYDHTATLLTSGKVLVAGGYDAGGTPLATAILYDPATGLWSAPSAMASAHASHTATLLASGKVLVASGTVGGGGAGTASDLYDPATNSWTGIGALATARRSHSATLLPDGRVLAVGGLATIGSALASVERFDPGTGAWTPVASLGVARGTHSTVLLPNGTVLAAGGGFSVPANTSLSSAEIYDPVTDAWSSTGALAAARRRHTATLLPNGTVLVVGGDVAATSTPLASSERYDPGTGNWSSAGALSTARSDHTASLLASGSLLVAGGFAAGGASLAQAERLDPTADSWTATGALATARGIHTMTFLPDGQVLAAGGRIASGQTIGSAERYNPVTGAWSATGALNVVRDRHGAVLLPNGKVLAAGGAQDTGGDGVYLQSAELYDPASGAWTLTGSLATTRHSHSLTLLPNGKVLAAGGSTTGGTPLTSAELYDPATGAWSSAGSLTTPRTNHTATLLPSGKVLVVGGYLDAPGTIRTASAELYEPATNTWTATGALATARGEHTATLLPSGRVLVIGGYGAAALGSSEIYDPTIGTWSAASPLANARYDHVAMLLPTGVVLVAGGYNPNPMASAEVYDPATNQWRAAANLNVARGAQYPQQAILLLTGQILLAGGGIAGGIATTSSELYDTGLGFAPIWRPVVNSATSPLAIGTALSAAGSGFRGLSEASSGDGAQNSPTDYPIVQLRSLGNGQVRFLPVSAATGWSSTAFVSTPLASFPPGHALATVFVNGIPSASRVILIQSGSTVTGVAFNDANKSGVREPGEPGLAGVTVFIDVNGNGGLDAGEPNDVTDASGAYTLAGTTGSLARVCQVVATTRIATSAHCTSIVLPTTGLDFGSLPRLTGCTNGTVTSTIVALDPLAGAAGFYRPTQVGRTATTGPWAGTRLYIPSGAGNPLVYIQKGEQVSNAQLVSGVSAATNANLVLKLKYIKSYQKVVAVVAADGTVAPSLGSGSALPATLPTTFSAFDRNGELFIFGVPQDGQGGYQDVYVITEATATRGYITTSAAIAGKVVNNVLTTIGNTCGDRADTSIVTGAGGLIGSPSPVDDVPNQPF